LHGICHACPPTPLTHPPTSSLETRQLDGCIIAPQILISSCISTQQQHALFSPFLKIIHFKNALFLQVPFSMFTENTHPFSLWLQYLKYMHRT
jgi:hypothetical protein